MAYPDALHPLWVGFWYGEQAAVAVTQRLGAIADAELLQHYGALTHHADEVWHVEVFAGLLAHFPLPIPEPPAWATLLMAQIARGDSAVDLVVGTWVIEASALFLLRSQVSYAQQHCPELATHLKRIWHQEQGHVEVACRYLRHYLQTASDAARVRSQMLSQFRFMRDVVRPQFVAQHLEPALPVLGISISDYETAARTASAQALRSVLR